MSVFYGNKDVEIVEDYEVIFNDICHIYSKRHVSIEILGKAEVFIWISSNFLIIFA